MIKSMRFFAVLFAMMISSISAHAACSNNEDGVAGVAGEIEYFTGDNALRYCDGTNWIDMVDARPDAPAASLGTPCGQTNCGGDLERRIVFLTGHPGPDNLPGGGGISGSDLLCQNAANAAGLSGTYLAWIADSNANSAPAFRFEQSSVPYVMVNGEQVDNNWADLVNGNIDTNIDIYQSGAVETGSRFIFTNVNTNGTQETTTDHCGNWTTDAGNGARGDPRRDNIEWTNSSSVSCTVGFINLYCFEQLGPKHVWTFDEGSGTTATDSIEGKNFTTVSGTPTWVSGPRGNAIVFDNNVEMNSPLNSSTPINHQFTFSGWVNVSNFESGRAHIFGKDGGTNSTKDFRFHLETNELRIYLNDGTGDVEYDTNFVPTKNIWYHYAIVREADGDLLFFVDGVLNTTFTGTITPQKIIDEYQIGRGVSGTGFYGSIDDFRIYNYALTVDEINELYAGPVAIFELDETSGTIYDDSSVYNFDQTDSDPDPSSDSIPAPNGTGIRFDGTNGIFYGNNRRHINFVESNAFTISAWVRPDDPVTTSNEIQTIFTKGSVQSSNVNSMVEFILTTTNKPKIKFYDNESGSIIGETIADPNTIDIGQWQHLVARWDGTDLEIWKNGVLLESSNQSGKSIRPDGNVFSGQVVNVSIGYDPTSGGRYFFNGGLDDLLVWNRAISDTEITALYNQGRINAGFLNGLVGHWRLDETGTTTTAIDSSPVGNNGTMNLVSGTDTVNAPVDSGLSFDGVANERISVPNNAAYDFTGGFSLGGWYKFEGTSADTGMRLISRQDGSEWYFLQYGPADDHLRFGVNLGGGNRNLYSPSGVAVGSSGKWHHVMGVRENDASTLRLYVDGIEVNTVTGATGTTNISGAALIIGNIGGNEAWKGDLDDIRIYNRALTADEVAALYADADGKIPCNTAGEYFYNTLANVYQWCDGSVIRFMGPPSIPNDDAQCSSQPFIGSGGAVLEGALGFSGRTPSEDVMYYCQGGEAIPIGKLCTECGGESDTKVVFTTNAASNGNAGGVAGLDASCQAKAKMFGLSGTYLAWVATSAADQPATRFSVAIRGGSYDIRMPDGTLIANNWADLIDGDIQNDINKDGSGFVSNGNVIVHTNVNTNGTVTSTTAANHCSGFTSTTGNVSEGQTNRDTGAWTDDGSDTVSCSSAVRVYCFEQ